MHKEQQLQSENRTQETDPQHNNTLFHKNNQIRLALTFENFTSPWTTECTAAIAFSNSLHSGQAASVIKVKETETLMAKIPSTLSCSS